MTKEILLKEIEKYTDEIGALSFVKSANIDDLKRLELSILWILSMRLTKKQDFIKEYCEMVNILEELKTKHKVMGDLLCKALESNSKITAKEFFEKYHDRISRIEQISY